MAIQHRPGQPKAWRVYWNNPYTGKRQSVSFESKQEAEKHDSLIKHQLKYEKERFQPQEQLEPQKEKNDNSLEGLFYTFLKEKQFNRKGHTGSISKEYLKIRHSLDFLCYNESQRTKGADPCAF